MCLGNLTLKISIVSVYLGIDVTQAEYFRIHVAGLNTGDLHTVLADLLAKGARDALHEELGPGINSETRECLERKSERISGGIDYRW